MRQKLTEPLFKVKHEFLGHTYDVYDVKETALGIKFLIYDYNYSHTWKYVQSKNLKPIK